MYNIEPLEQDLETTVITWMNVMIWSTMKRCKVKGPIKGFGRLLGLSAHQYQLVFES
jgi:maleate cis-trans isomerase